MLITAAVAADWGTEDNKGYSRALATVTAIIDGAFIYQMKYNKDQNIAEPKSVHLGQQSEKIYHSRLFISEDTFVCCKEGRN